MFSRPTTSLFTETSQALLSGSESTTREGLRMESDLQSREIAIIEAEARMVGAVNLNQTIQGDLSSQSKQQTETKISELGVSIIECGMLGGERNKFEPIDISCRKSESKALYSKETISEVCSSFKPILETNVSQYLKIYKSRKNKSFSKNLTDEPSNLPSKLEPAICEINPSLSAASISKKTFSRYLAASGNYSLAKSMRDSAISAVSMDSRASSELKRSYYSHYLHKYQASTNKLNNLHPINHEYISMLQDKMNRYTVDSSSRYLDWSMKKSGDQTQLNNILCLGLKSPEFSRRPSQVSKLVDNSRAEGSVDSKRDQKQVSFQIGDDMISPQLNGLQMRDKKSILKNKHSAHVAVSKVLQFDRKYTPSPMTKKQSDCKPSVSKKLLIRLCIHHNISFCQARIESRSPEDTL